MQSKDFARRSGTRLTPRRRAPWLLLALLATAPALAQDSLRLSGFGTVGYAVDNRSTMAATRDISQKPDDGFHGGPRWAMDTRLGVQLEYAASPTVDLVGQFVLRDHFRADVDSATELAYVALKPDDRLDLRAGRINYDAFLMSEYRNVGYAYQWIRPPVEFYGWIPIFSLNGVDAAYQVRAGDAHWRLKAQAGSSRFSIPIGEGYDFKADDLLGLSLTRQTESWRLKAAYSSFVIGSEVPAFAPLHQGLDQVAAMAPSPIGAEAADLRRQLSFRNARVSYATLGAAYDNGVWLGQAEIGHSTATADVVPNAKMAYFGVGRRIGEWTPHLMLSTSRPNNKVRPATASWGALDAPLRDPALYVLNTTRIEQTTLSLGVRWDFHRRSALKLQWDRTTVKPSGYGLWWRDLAANGQTSRVHQVAATLDFTF